MVLFVPPLAPAPATPRLVIVEKKGIFHSKPTATAHAHTHTPIIAIIVIVPVAVVGFIFVLFVDGLDVRQEQLERFVIAVRRFPTSSS